MNHPTPPDESKGRTLRKGLTITFVSVSLLSVLLLGALQFFEARELLTDSVSNQLRSEQATKAREVRDGLDRIEATAVLIARAQDTVQSLLDLSEAYGELLTTEQLLDPGQDAEVEALYAATAGEIGAAGLPVPAVEELSPRTEAGRYLHYHYIVQNPFGRDERRQLASAEEDASSYGDAHATHHPRLAELGSQLGFSDLLLVDATGNVVYSTDKRLDFGTNAQTGPWSDSAIGQSVTTRLAAAAVGDAVLNDVSLYIPGGGTPSMFAAAAVRDQAQTIGAVLVKVPIALLNEITTSGGTFGGLGDTGEIYVVGRDGLLRTDARRWLEDPDEYLETALDAGLDENAATAMTIFDTTVVLQPADTSAVAEAFDDRLFVGRTSNYLGRNTLTVAGQVGSDHVDWVVVADLAASEADKPLRRYVIRVGVAAALLVPLVALVALFLADRLTRPARPLVETASRVAAGDLSAAAPDLGSNEFGDAARRLNILTADLRAQEDALGREEQEIRHLLLSALPPRLVEKLRRDGAALEDLVDSATVVAVTVTGVFEAAAGDPESVVDLAARLSGALEELSARLGTERVHSASDLHVFVAGLDEPDPAVDTAARFAIEAGAAVEHIAEELDAEVGCRIGVSAGEVVSGVLEVEKLTYGLFGDPPRTALMLNSIAAPGQILVDESTGALLGAAWQLESAPGLIDLQGQEVAAQLLRVAPVTEDQPIDQS